MFRTRMYKNEKRREKQEHYGTNTSSPGRGIPMAHAVEIVKILVGEQRVIRASESIRFGLLLAVGDDGIDVKFFLHG